MCEARASDMDVTPACQPSVKGPKHVNRRILVVEDVADTAITLKKLLELALGSPVDLASDGAEALQMLLQRPYSVVVTDLKMPRLSGMELLTEIQARQLDSTVIVTTGHGSIPEAVQAMNMGAYEFLTKPTDPDHLILLIQRAQRERALRDEVIALREQLQERCAFRTS